MHAGKQNTDITMLDTLSLVLAQRFLRDVGEHGCALCRLEILGARLLKKRLGLRPKRLSALR
jgi:hypothetical protein